MNTIITNVNEIVDRAYLVGGSVRDMALHQVPKDYDFCTPLLPDDIEARVKAAGKRAYTIGKRFGTIGFKVDGQMVEVTTFRHEQYEPGNRKPTVEFETSLMSDLSRRDFTMNAMAYRNKKYYDPFGGRIDILAKKIKPVGNGTVRIKEDPLRMLRAARFAAQLGFEVDPNFIGTMRKHAHKIMAVSRERWVQEIDKLLMTKEPQLGLVVLSDSHVLKYILPELWVQIDYDQNSPYHELTLWEHTINVVAKAPMDVDLRWAALLHDVGKPYARTENKRGFSNYIKHDMIGAYMSEGIALRLRWSNSRREKVVNTILTHLQADNPIREADNASKIGLTA